MNSTIIDHRTLRLWALPLLLWASASAVCAQDCGIYRASQTPEGIPGNGGSFYSRVSGDGRFVAFTSGTTNLVPNDTNGFQDVFVHDYTTNAIQLVSVAADGTQGNGLSQQPSISSDGRFVVFMSKSSNMAPGDEDSKGDLFVRDTRLGITTLITARTDPTKSSEFGVSPTRTSSSGELVNFASMDTNFAGVTDYAYGYVNVFLHDVRTRGLRLVNVSSTGEIANRSSFAGDISGDGRYVLFSSTATNLGFPNPLERSLVFRRDLLLNTTECVSYAVHGAASFAGLLSNSLGISRDGRWIAFVAHPAWYFPHGDLVHWPEGILLRDTATGALEYVGSTAGMSRPDQGVDNFSMSDDARFFAYSTRASNIVPGLPEGAGGTSRIFRADRLTGAVELVSKSNAGVENNSDVTAPEISGDGRTVVFDTPSSNLVPNDPFSTFDVFVRRCGTNSVVPHCGTVPNSDGCKPRLATRGEPGLGSAAPLEVQVTGFLPERSALLLIGEQRPALQPVRFNQFLCLAAPRVVAGPQTTGGSAQVACSGGFSLDLNSYFQAHPGDAPALGSVVFLQAWCSDPMVRGGSSLSDSVAFVMMP